MMHGLYVVYDLIAGMMVGGVHVHMNEASAARMFRDLVDPKSGTVVSQHPADFELRCIAQLDPVTLNVFRDGADRVVLRGDVIVAMNTQQEIEA